MNRLPLDTVLNSTENYLAAINAFTARSSTADVVATGADTYLVGVPLLSLAMFAEMQVRFEAYMTKTAASTATPIWTIRIGTAGTVADAAIVTFTGPAQTAAADIGLVEISGVLRNVGAAGILAAGLSLTHDLAITGFASQGNVVRQTTSSGFVTTTAGLVVGLSCNPGAAGVFTHQMVTGTLRGI